MPRKQADALSGGLAAALASVASALASVPEPGMIIGGVAVILHGVPRLTRDIDATVAASSIALDALATHFGSYGIGLRSIDALEFAERSQVLLLRHQASGIDVDLSLAWLPFELEAITARQRLERGRLRVDVARPEDLIIYKAVAWRPQDQQDIERLLTLYLDAIDLQRTRAIIGDLAEALDESDRLTHFDVLLERARGSDV